MQPYWPQLQPSLQANELFRKQCLLLPLFWSRHAMHPRLCYLHTQEQHAHNPASACDSRSHDMHAWNALLHSKYACHVNAPAKHCTLVRKTPSKFVRRHCWGLTCTTENSEPSIMNATLTPIDTSSSYATMNCSTAWQKHQGAVPQAGVA